MKSSLLIHPNCKINIGLHIVRRREDGYHDLETLFYPIPLRDNLEITLADTDDAPFNLALGGKKIEGKPADNIITKVYDSLRDEFKFPPMDVHLYKHIPTGAGLGGGSSDAAFMLKGLNEFFELGLSDDEMERRVAQFGADCAFFVRNKAAYARGIGDVLAPYPLSLKGKFIVLVKPDVFISTKEAYANVRPHAPQFDLTISLKQPIETWRHTVFNDFEESVFPNHPELPAIKQTLYDMGALYASMSGSGSTLYGIFDRPVPEAEKVFKDCFVFTKNLVL